MVERVRTHPPIPPMDDDPGASIPSGWRWYRVAAIVVAFVLLMTLMFWLERRDANTQYDAKCVTESGQIVFEGIATRLRGNDPWQFRDAKTWARIETDTHCIFIRRAQ